jgi:ring-1,2-phenylacetyl-CoA epoxidase subunit PaaE
VHLSHHYVVLAAGRGMLGLMPLIETLLARDSNASLRVFYADRDRASAKAAEPLLALKDRHLDRLALHFILSEEPQAIGWLNGSLGSAKVEELAGRLFDPSEVRQFIVCAERETSADVGAALGRLGVPAERLRIETPEHAGAPGSSPPVREGATLAQVTVIMDGRRRAFTVKRDADTLLEAAAAAGIDLPYSCKAGVCSTCRTKLLKGEVRLEQNYALEEWELAQGYILACQAHARTAELEISYDEK